MNLMLPDPKSGNPSTARTVFWYGCLICLGKLALSKIEIESFKIPEFTGSEFAVAIGALGSIYALDKHITKNKEDK